jgi:xylan 1,4-beta-xylosidase
MTLRTAIACLAAASSLCLSGCTEVTSTESSTAQFNWFEYRGNDQVFEEPLAKDQYQNPIVAGFYPDPSITRAGDDFYMVHSSFAYYPGVPILHSTNLVDWRLMGHILTRPEQLQVDNMPATRGIFAPTIRYHDGTFYMITTEVDGRGNFMVTAKDPAGPWSDPILLPEVGGIDPDIFFDDDGRVYIAHNDAPQGEPLYEGHRAIWLWEYDPSTQSVIKDSGRVIVNGGVDLSKQPIWIEAPHIFKKDSWYYLSCAEGGTGYNHSQVIFRTRDLNEPFEPYAHNPILTQRDLDPERPAPITNAGHADMVQTPAGEWWAVFLAVRPYEPGLFNTGRETFLLPVTWQNGWPDILPPGEEIPYRHRKPADLPATANAETMTGNFVWHDSFEGESLSPHWNLLRTGNKSWYSLKQAPGTLSMTALPVSLTDLHQPAFLARRQQHTAFEASTELELPLGNAMSAGFTAFQGEHFHYYLGVRRHGDDHTVFLERVRGSEPETVASHAVAGDADTIVLGAEGNAGTISFFYTAGKDDKRNYISKSIDARMLSTEIAGGFVGTHLGVHARQEQDSDQ